MSREMYTQGDYLKKNPRWHVDDSAWKAKQILKIIERNNLHPASICEIGCGAGEILNQLYLHLPTNVSFTGYEISPQAFELCQKRKRDRMHFLLKDIFQDDKAFFDIILVIDVLEHIEDYLGFLKNIRGKGQYKIFHIPLDISVQTVLRVFPILKERQERGHLHYFIKETALAMLKDSDYEILDYFYTAPSVDLPAKSPLSLLTKLPRKIMFAINKDMAVRILGRYELMVLAK